MKLTKLPLIAASILQLPLSAVPLGRHANAVLATVVGSAVFAIDTLAPSTAAVGLLYALPVFIVGFSLSVRALLLATGAAFLLSSLSFAISPAAEVADIAVLNSALAAIGIATSAVVSWLYQQRSANTGRSDDCCSDLNEVQVETQTRLEQTTSELWDVIQPLMSDEERVGLILDRMNEGVFGIDSDGNCTFCNPACVRMLGYDRAEQVMHRQMRDLIHTSRMNQRPLDTGICNIRSVLRTGVECFCNDEVFTRANGTTIPVEYQCFPIVRNDAVAGAIVMFTDVTERLVSERRFREQEEQLHYSQRMEAVGRLAAGVAHEYNNLIQAIMGYTQFAQRSLPADTDAFQDLDQVLSISNRAATLTHQLLDFSRQDTIRPLTIDVAKVIEDLTSLVRTCVPQSIDVRIDVRDGESILHADPGLLQQVLMNICVNALDAMDAVGTLRIASQKVSFTGESAISGPALKPGDYIQLSIADTGTGIPPKLKERIFEPFFTTKDVGKGTGMGLAMVFGVVQQHGGAVCVDSSVNEGATFHIYLPLHQEEQESEPSALPTVSWAGRNELILIAEDEPLVRKIAVRVLEGAGYRTLTAEDGEQAVEQFSMHADDIDLLLFDVVMPNMGGKEAAATIRLIRPDISVAFCTGYDASSAAIKNTDFQSTFVVEKPFDHNEFLKTVRAALDNRSEQRQLSDQHEAMELNP